MGSGASYITHDYNGNVWLKWPDKLPGKAYINGQHLSQAYGTYPADIALGGGINQWVHYCITFNGNWSGTIRWGHNNAAAGHKENFTHQYIDDVKFYDQMLTDSQVAELYAGNEPQGVTITHTPLDASGTSVPALKSIYEQLMNVPGRSQIMQTRDISGVQDNSNVTLAGGFPLSLIHI